MDVRRHKGKRNSLIRLLCVLAFAAAVLMIPAAASADDSAGTDPGTIYWVVDADKNLTISDKEIAAPEGGRCGSFAADAEVFSPWGRRDILSVKVEGHPKPYNMKEWFCLSTYVKTIDLTGLDASECTSMNETFYWCDYLESITFGKDFDVSKCTDMSGMFARNPNLKYIDLNNLKNAKPKTVTRMFYECGSLEEADLSVFDLSECENAYHMLEYCSRLKKFTVGDTYKNNGEYSSFEFPYGDYNRNCAWTDMKTRETYFGALAVPYGAGVYEFGAKGKDKYDAWYALKGNSRDGYDLVVSPDKPDGDFNYCESFNTASEPRGWESKCTGDKINSVEFRKGKNGAKVKYPVMMTEFYNDSGEDEWYSPYYCLDGFTKAETVDLDGLDLSECKEMFYWYLGGHEFLKLGDVQMPASDTKVELIINDDTEVITTGPGWAKESKDCTAVFSVDMYRADDGSFTKYNADDPLPAYEESGTGNNIFVTEDSSEVRADVAAAVSAAKKMMALKNVTSLSQKADVEKARAAYNALTDAQKVYISSEALRTLDAAEASVKSLAVLRKGDSVTKGYLVYTVTDASAKTVSVKLTAKGKKKAKTVKIAGTVAVKGVACRVTAVPAKGFAGAKKLKKVTGGANLLTIGTKGFANDKKLRTFKITSRTLNKIGKKSFYKCKKLKKIYLTKTTKLKKAGVKQSLKGSKVKTVKVKKSKKKAYKKIFRKKNCGKKVRVK